MVVASRVYGGSAATFAAGSTLDTSATLEADAVTLTAAGATVLGGAVTTDAGAISATTTVGTIGGHCIRLRRDRLDGTWPRSRR